MPTADIYDMQGTLTVMLEMPGAEKSNVGCPSGGRVLTVQGRLALSNYQGLQPFYTEYNIGQCARSFQLSSKIDQNKFAAELKDGVLTLTLSKIERSEASKKN